MVHLLPEESCLFPPLVYVLVLCVVILKCTFFFFSFFFAVKFVFIILSSGLHYHFSMRFNMLAW